MLEFGAPEFDANNDELVELIAYTLANAGRDLAAFSNAHLEHGLAHIFNNSCSNICFSLMDHKVDLKKRVQAVKLVSNLYTDCFEQRCAPVLGHLDQPGANELNHICYMLWDVTPIAYWEGSSEKDIFYPVLLEVMSAGLRCKNVACIEGALHGLGHLHVHTLSSRVKALVHEFIRRNPELPLDLGSYAKNAAIGCVL